MGYIVHSGKVAQSDDFDLIEEYAKLHRTKVVSAEMWPFVSMPIGLLSVTWKNGAVGWFTASDFRGMREYLDSLGWPLRAFTRGLPARGGQALLIDDTGEKEAHATVAKVTRRIRPSNTDAVHTLRRTRTRTTV